MESIRIDRQTMRVIIDKKDTIQGVDVFEVLFLIFLVLKLTKLISWSWIWIFSPLIINILMITILLAGKSALNKLKKLIKNQNNIDY